MIDDTNEYIIASAIWYKNGKHYHFMDVYGIDNGFVLCGFRHPLILSILPTNYTKCDENPDRNPTALEWNSNAIPDTYDFEEDGFITSYGRFVNRKEGAQIAYKCGQISEPLKVLYSEDVFPNQINKGHI